ncbi:MULTISPECIES: lyase family protein [Bacillaceae]|uniref:lyase family protein n=1 Tax=Bacillales TaxID=1385 RepID=UPI0018846889|nr:MULTISPECIES: lyase family protein [Bacillaceae]MBF0707935.1 aspartate ammonia-lyase [Pseudalkalibacillus hwajinpoensis]MDO6654310.1 lyase family protein [Anaerobacillus sp. 1_MG-2023]
MRYEQDEFGTVKIPSEALYGIQTVRSTANLSFSEKKLTDYPDYVKALSIVKKAATLANGEAGVLPKRIQDAIVTACDELISGKHVEHFPVDPYHGGGGIGSNMNVNEVVSNRANQILGYEIGSYEEVQPNDHVNASQSTSDVCHTAIRLTIARQLEKLLAVVKSLQQSIREKANEWSDVMTISRTCLQDGMRVPLGDSMSGVEALLDRRMESLQKATEQMDRINLGGTVIGSGIGASEGYRKNILHYLRETTSRNVMYRDNLFDAAQHLDDLGDVSNELRQLASGLIKFGKDLRIRASGPETGFGELSLPAVQAGSSFFPGKVNPVIPETLIQCCFKVLGCDRTVQAALEHGELDLNVFEGVAGMAIIDAIQMLTNVLPVFEERCVKGIRVNEATCRDYANTTIPLVVDLKERFGYEAVSNAMKTDGKDGLLQLQANGGY